MHRTLLHLSFAVITLAGLSTAQQVLTTTLGTLPGAGLGTVVRAVGDVDRDGTPDFAVSEPNTSPGRVRLISGRTRAPLATFVSPSGNGFGALDVNPIGDADGDGTVDFAIGYASRGPLAVYSGATGARLYTLGSPFEYYGYACSVGDYDGDGKDDFAAVLYINSSVQIWVLRGLTGAQLAVVTTSSASDGILRNLGDLNGDGFPEIAACGRPSTIYDLHPIHLLRTINLNPVVFAPLRQVEVADIDGDGKNDLLLGFNVGQGAPFLFAVSAMTGAILRSYSLPPDDSSQPSGSFSVLPDLDGDGRPDFVACAWVDPLNANTSTGVVDLLSSADGRRLGAWSSNPQFPSSGGTVAGLGDVDGDGIGDFVIGAAGLQAGAGGWQLISGRVLANMRSRSANCYAGPFAPQLGLTRPVLGQTMTVAGRDAPAPGLVMLGFLPMDRTNLGVVGCDLWFDPLAWSLLGVTVASPSWQFGVALPNQVGLRGVEVALQALYPNAAMPVGLELSNGVWARLGY